MPSQTDLCPWHLVVAAASAALMGMILPVQGALAEEAHLLRIDGAVGHVLTLSADDLAALPQSDVRVTYKTGHGQEEATYSGVSLWALLGKADLGPLSADKPTRTAHYLMLSARDGYRVVVALGEIDPELEGKSAIVALKRNGVSIPDKEAFRLALPGDSHGARNLHALDHIEVR